MPSASMEGGRDWRQSLNIASSPLDLFHWKHEKSQRTLDGAVRLCYSWLVKHTPPSRAYHPRFAPAVALVILAVCAVVALPCLQPLAGAAEFRAGIATRVVTPDPLLPVSGGVGPSH